MNDFYNHNHYLNKRVSVDQYEYTESKDFFFFFKNNNAAHSELPIIPPAQANKAHTKNPTETPNNKT